MTREHSDKDVDMRRFILEPADRSRLGNLVGPEDENIRQISDRLGVEILHSGASFAIKGKGRKAIAAERIIKQLYLETAPVGKQKKAQYITPDKVNLAIIENTHLEADKADSPDPLDYIDEQSRLEQAENARATLKKQVREGEGDRGSVGELYHKASTLKTQRGVIKARTPNQAGYISQIISHDVSFGIGPAGTGKTFLAVAAAVDALTRNEVRRIILTRPAVEAGEKLGFLPGDLTQKVDPYLRPLYDALFEMLGFEKVEKLIERQVIEIAPLAYMRGRTLNDSFIILDEAQNTTIEQMKMFLTRIGFNSKAVITGDPSQVDLPRNVRSGLRHAMEVLERVEAISFTYFLSEDVVRHPVVAAIVNAYDAWDKKEKEEEERNGSERRGRDRWRDDRSYGPRRYGRFDRGSEPRQDHEESDEENQDSQGAGSREVAEMIPAASQDSRSSRDHNDSQADHGAVELFPSSHYSRSDSDSSDQYRRSLDEDVERLKDQQLKVEQAFTTADDFDALMDDLMGSDQSAAQSRTDGADKTTAQADDAAQADESRNSCAPGI